MDVFFSDMFGSVYLRFPQGLQFIWFAFCHSTAGGVGSSSGVSMHPPRSELGMARKLPQVLRGFCCQYTDMSR